jgi:hypothetical protein
MIIEKQIIKKQDEIIELKNQQIQTLKEIIEEQKKYEIQLKRMIELLEKEFWRKSI